MLFQYIRMYIFNVSHFRSFPIISIIYQYFFHFLDTLMADSSLVNAKNLKVLRVNGISFDSFLTLHTNQTINHEINIDETEAKVFIVNQYVNQMDLKSERENTVMVRSCLEIQL